MALVVTEKAHIQLGSASLPGGEPLKLYIFDVAFDSSYPTGGETMDISAKIPTLLFISIPAKTGYSFEYDLANKKLLAYWGDNNNANDAPAVQVADTTDLSALTVVPVMALGY